MDAGSLDPSILNQIPQEIQANAPHLSVFERITLCEINIIGSSAPKKAVPERLANLEKQLFGEHFISQQPAIVSRINNVIFNTQLPNELVADAVADSLTKPDWASRKASTRRWLRTALQRVELLETELNNRMQKDLL